MVYLDKTANALAHLHSIEYSSSGDHTSSLQRVNPQGEYISEHNYDPANDDPMAIDPFSPWQEIMDAPQVVERHPFKPLETTIVVHQPRGSFLDEQLNMGDNRRYLAKLIAKSIDLSMPDASDQVYTYIVGEDARVDKLTDGEVVLTDGDLEKESKQISELCISGLNIVISDFIRLKFQEDDGISVYPTFAVKANLPTDLALPQTKLILRSGEKTGEIKSSDKDKTNQRLQENHNRTIEMLRSLGLGVAAVCLIPKDISEHEFIDSVDPALAQAVTDIEAKALTV